MKPAVKIGSVLKGATALALLALLAGPMPAQADFGVAAFDGGVFDAQGDAFTQAGGHPDSGSATFSLNRRLVPNSLYPDGSPYPDGGELRNAIVDLPAGLLGNPAAVPACPRDRRIPSDEDAQYPDARASDFCPLAAIVGRASVVANQDGIATRLTAPVFNMEPPPGVAAQFAFSIYNQRAYLDAVVRNDGDYGVSVRARDVSQGVPILDSEVTLWGVPADPRHDAQRCLAFVRVNASEPTPECDPDSPLPLLRPASVDTALNAFLANPTRCTPPGVGLETSITVSSWMPGLAEDRASFISHEPPGYPLAPLEWGPEVGVTGCERLPFEPNLRAQPDSTRPDSPTGLDVSVTMPQESIVNPLGLTPAHLRRVSVTLPAGMTVNPSSASGLQACSDEQLGIGTDGPARCPEASKIGSVTAQTPVLEETLEGSLYVGSQNSDDPESGEMFRLFLSLNSPERGIAVKLRGQVRADADTGRLETVFDNNPQVPVSNIEVRLKGGTRAPLATPAACGPTLVEASMGSWAGQERALTDPVTIDCPGIAGFAPRFDAGSTQPKAGTFSPFVVHVERSDLQENLAGLSIELPQGSLARLRGVTVCPDADAAAGSCPGASLVGSATVAAGAGSTPFYLADQPVYLAGPYKGAPYSLSVATRAKAGPFDLGAVVVRQALHVDRNDGHVTVVSDPLPTIVKGVPLRLRAIHATVDRPGFALTPTSCEQKRVGATLQSLQGSTAAQSARFQVGECGTLPFDPKLELRLTGARQTTTGRHPGIHARVTQTGIGEAGIGRARVELPKSLALDPDNARALCEFVDGTKPDLENHCPRGSVVGRARAVTPLLDRPLTGDVYFVKNVRRSSSGNLIRTLPMIVVALRGQIAINLRGVSSTTRGGKLVNTFAEVPDAPITRFDLSVAGGGKGIIAVTRTRRSKIDLCDRPRSHRALVDMSGQNGKRARSALTVKAPCAKSRTTTAAERRRGR